MAKNLAALQKALNAKSNLSSLPLRADADAATKEQINNQGSNYYVAPSRTGKVNITAYLSPDYKRNLRLIQARTGRSLQSLIAEALNDVFQKYDVPTIHEE